MSWVNTIWEPVIANSCIYFYWYLIFFCINIPIYPFFAEGYLAYFQFWVITSNSTLNILAYIILVCTYMSFSRTHVVVETLNCNLCTSSTVVNNATLSSEAAIPFCIPTRSEWESLLLCLLVSMRSESWHSNKYILARFSLWFWIAFFWWYMM